MCGRFFQDVLEEDLREYFEAHSSSAAKQLELPRFNIAPGQDILVVRRDKQHDQRSLDALHWGLIPHFAPDKKGAYRMINARAESVDRAPSYRAAFEKRRCIVVAHGFYEWKKQGKQKQPFAIAKRDRTPLALAGIWENWLDKESGEWLRSVAIITTAANDTLRPLHDRMPVVLEKPDFAAWLGEESLAPEQIKAMLRPSSAAFDVWPVDPRMNRVQVEDPQIIEPIALEPEKRP